jgi:subtilisin family serine protease
MIGIRFSALGLVAVAALAACSDAATTTASGPITKPKLATAAVEDEIAPGRILVKFTEGTDGDAVLREHGGTVRGAGAHGSFLVVAVARGSERATAGRLRAHPGVEFAEPDYLRHVEVADPRLWAFYNPGGLNMSFYNDPGGATGTIPASYASVADADEDAIAGAGVGGSSVVISGIDTGVDFSHPEFAGRLIRGCDWYSQADSGNSSRTCTDFSSDDTPEEGHGTHTAGTMGGSEVGVAGATGAASNVKILVQRVCGTAGCYTSAIVNAIYAAADYPGMVAMNLSLSGSLESSAEKAAINYAVNTKGVLVIAAAGNAGTNRLGCPACDPNAIAVSATDWKDALASYSQYGKGLDISAPGGYCYSNTTEDGCIFSAVVAGYSAATGFRSYTGPLAGGSYAYMNGTSMAAPQVTGAAAVVASKTGLRGSALRARLESTADDKGAGGYDIKFGNGRLNVYRAITGSTPANGL